MSARDGRVDEARRILGRYRLDERIAIGGTADVWRAYDETLGREVAVKLLHEHLLPDAASRARIEAEARAAARLTHPGIVGVYDIYFGPDEAAVVMELVRGRSAGELLATRGRFPPREVARIGAEVAEALAHAHARGVVHRDVKPGNILVADDGRARLVDFGIARQLAENARRLTTAGTVVGTLRYMAPEQLAGEPGDQRSDVWALGATLYELLAGRPPFDVEAPGALLAQQRQRPAPIPRVPPALMTIVLDALEPDPDRRIPDAEAMARRLRGWLDTGVDRAAPAETTTAPAAPIPRPPVAPPARVPRAAGTRPGPRVAPRRRRRAPGWLRPLLVALLVTGAGLGLIAAVVASPGFGIRLPGGDVSGLPTRTASAAEDARVALADGSPVGAGANETLPVGEYQSFLYRSLVRFRPDYSGMSRVRRIELRLCTTDQDRVRRGERPAILVRRNVRGDWEEGSAGQPSGSNAVTWANAPETTDSDAVEVATPTRSNDCFVTDITALYLPMVDRGAGGGGSADLGLTLSVPSDDRTHADPQQTTEFWSSEAGDRGPRLVITYEAG